MFTGIIEEIGEITAGIAVPEGRGVRFFSSARDFDGLDGTVFRTAEQAARAARARVSARARTAALELLWRFFDLLIVMLLLVQ